MEDDGVMSEEQLRSWMKLVNTQMLELILLEGTPGKPEWFTRIMTEEVQRRRAERKARPAQ